MEFKVNQPSSPKSMSKRSSERKFGLLFSVVAIVAAWYGWGRGFVAAAGLAVLLAGLFLTTALTAPEYLARLNRAWLILGDRLHRVVSPITLGVIFFLLLTPVAWVRRLAGIDPMQRKFDPTRSTYWVNRAGRAIAPSSFRDQF